MTGSMTGYNWLHKRVALKALWSSHKPARAPQPEVKATGAEPWLTPTARARRHYGGAEFPLPKNLG